MKEEIILGIDPGFSVTGFGVIKKNHTTAQLKDCGYLKMKSTDSLSKRIGQFYDFFIEKIKLHAITMIALETPFLGKNTQSFLKLGYLRGILYLLAEQHQLLLSEFAPRQVKAAVTGSGAATKDQVAFMVMRLFPKVQEYKAAQKQDVTDALAVSLCGFWHSQAQQPRV